MALRVCRDLRAANSADDKVRKREVQLLSFYSPEKALELCDDFIVNSENAEYFRASKNWNAALLKRPEDMTLDKSLLPAAGALAICPLCSYNPG